MLCEFFIVLYINNSYLYYMKKRILLLNILHAEVMVTFVETIQCDKWSSYKCLYIQYKIPIICVNFNHCNLSVIMSISLQSSGFRVHRRKFGVQLARVPCLVRAVHCVRHIWHVASTPTLEHGRRVHHRAGPRSSHCHLQTTLPWGKCSPLKDANLCLLC